MNKNYYICVFYSNVSLEDVFIHDENFFYPLIDDFSYGLKPSQLILEKTNDNFKNYMKKNSVKIKEEFFNQLKDSLIYHELSPELRSILIKYFPDKHEFFI